MEQLDFDVSPPANIMTFRLGLTQVTFDFFLVTCPDPGQTHGKTDTRRRIRAHHAWAQVGSKMNHGTTKGIHYNKNISCWPGSKSLKFVPSCFLIESNTTVLAGMFTPIANVSVANSTCKIIHTWCKQWVFFHFSAGNLRILSLRWKNSGSIQFAFIMFTGHKNLTQRISWYLDKSFSKQHLHDLFENW